MKFVVTPNCWAAALVFCAIAQAQTALYPIDDTPRDGGFRSYIGRLRAAVEKRDARALRKLVDDEVVVGRAKEDKGWTKFVEVWRPDDRDSPLWTTLSDLLSLGFIREHPELYLSPYLAWRFPSELNMATHLVVVKDKAALREEPSLNAPSLAALAFDIVRQLGPAEGAERLVQWIPVRTLDGKEGYVNSREVMSPLMPRAQFGTRGRRWLMIALEDPLR